MEREFALKHVGGVEFSSLKAFTLTLWSVFFKKVHYSPGLAAHSNIQFPWDHGIRSTKGVEDSTWPVIWDKDKYLLARSGECLSLQSTFIGSSECHFPPTVEINIIQPNLGQLRS